MRPQWNEYFLEIAKAVAKRSPDPKKQVGAVVIDNLNRIVSTGYNALPKGFPEKNIDWFDRDLVHSVIIHAECNALLYCNSKFSGASLYCTLSPCPECIKIIVACGIDKIYFIERYKKYEQSKAIAELFGIKLFQINGL